MFPSSGFVAILIAILLVIDLCLVFGTVLSKISSRLRFRKRVFWERAFSDVLVSSDVRAAISLLNVLPRDRGAFLTAWRRIARHLSIPGETFSALLKFVESWGIADRAERLLRSHFFSRRAKGRSLLEHVDQKTSVDLILSRLGREKNPVLLLSLAVAGLSLSADRAMDGIVGMYRRSSVEVRKRLLSIIERGDFDLDTWIERSYQSTDADVRRIVLSVAAKTPHVWTEEFVKSCIVDPLAEIRDRAYDIAAERYPSLVDIDEGLLSDDPSARTAAVKAFLSGDLLPDRERLSAILSDDSVRAVAVEALGRKLRVQGRYLDVFFEWYRTASDPLERMALAGVLEMRIIYFLRRSDGAERESIANLLRDIVGLGYSATVISFLNEDRNVSRRAAIHDALASFLDWDTPFLRQCRRYLAPEIRTEWNIDAETESFSTDRTGASLRDKLFLSVLLALTLLIMPVSFAIAYGWRFPYLRPSEIFVSFLFYFQYAFTFYVVTSNVIALALMALSAVHIRQQRVEWEVADKRFLFTPGILPTVSILAPAFNEEKSIVQSVHSLLSLEYPDFEVIVVNDGSTDRTLETMIGHFGLELADVSGVPALETALVVGVYRNPAIPNLLLVNKLNGGKADSLNAGVAFASGEYICGIDADSLLEPESLQRILFRASASGKELAAAGGNVIPVNGCVTFLGTLKSIHFPKNRYAQYQTIEYLRSFIAGRLGWARLGTLMIISGAFGVFRRERILEVGGYLTKRSVLHRDTVGEDMEIVVRIERRLHELKVPYVIDYAHNANSWTEVPEDADSLMRQRDRWHRGLLETMNLHRKMFLSPKYGAVGLIGFPYFFIFEMLGPFLEFIGYLSFLALFFLGLLSSASILLMFAVVVLLGMLVSSSALFMSERGIVYFQGKEFLNIVFLCFVENIGYRQYISALRALSYAQYIVRGGTGWNKAVRKGFRESST